MKNNDEILTANLRKELKMVLQNELEQLPEVLNSLPPKERLDVLCKLMPFIFPKVQNVSPTNGEPLQFGFD